MRWFLTVRALAGAAAIAAIVNLGGAQAQSLIQDPGLSVDTEAVFLQLQSSVGTRNANVYDFEPASRLALTYLNECNVGFRTTWFQFDHDRNDAQNRQFGFQTYNLDFEALKRLEFSQCTVLELSGGVRVNETEHHVGTEADMSDFDGVGGLLGIRGGIQVSEHGLLYARGKFCVLAGDGRHDGNSLALNPANELIRSQTEIGIGYEHCFHVGCVTIVPKIGAEWQMWDGFSIDPVDEHPDTDLGLFGLVTGVGINF